MAEHTSNDGRSPGEGPRGQGREGGRRPAGPREAGGFRIRLSDNEMRAAQAIQEAFRLRSTVAALGFSIRTLADLLEQGQLEALLAEHRARGGDRPAGRGAERSTTPRINPFARPQKPPAPMPPQVEVAMENEPSSDAPGETVAEVEAPAEASNEA